MPVQNKHIILVGLPGSGKSTLGRGLALKLGLGFKDLDTALVEKLGMSIPEVFSQRGEAYFREQEALCLREILSGPEKVVLATGGGAPCFHNNMELIVRSGISIYLEVPYTELAQRLLAAGVSKRPLLEGVQEPEALAVLLQNKFGHRVSFYKKADLHFRNTSDAAFAQLVKEVQAWND